MKEKDRPNSTRPVTPSKAGVRTATGLRAGYSCPQGWWKDKQGKSKMCCHWVYDPYWRDYTTECTT